MLTGLHERFATVSGIAKLLKYEPTTIQAFPTLYSLLDTVERSQAGQLTVMRYRVLNRIIFRWQDNEQAELELIPFVNSVPAAIDADAKLGGRVDSGLARVTDIQAVFVTIGALYRALDIYTEVLEKQPFKSGI